MDLRTYARLHLCKQDELWERWKQNPDLPIEDRLHDAFDRGRGVWEVRSESELTRLVGALQWRNPAYKLWFRGEGSYHERALPSRYRPGRVATATSRGVRWLNRVSGADRALRDRSPLARAALLQHYGCPTSFLDLTASVEVACAFAFERPRDPHLRVYALPRNAHAVAVFDAADVVLVDLRAEMPSYCLRPHVQESGFVARKAAASVDIDGGPDLPGASEYELDELCIAHLRLRIRHGSDRFYRPRLLAGTLYPPPSTSCRACPGGPKPSDMNNDFVLHLLRCLVRAEGSFDPAVRFPDDFAEGAERRGRMKLSGSRIGRHPRTLMP